jgi:hypothetical protein
MTTRTEDEAWYPARRGALAKVRRIALNVAELSPLVAGLLLAGLIGGSPIRADEPASIVLTEFDYVDSSGEMQNQTQKHAALIADFMQALRGDVGQSGKFRIVPFLCEGQPCTARGSNPSDLMTAARKAGVKLRSTAESTSKARSSNGPRWRSSTLSWTGSSTIASCPSAATTPTRGGEQSSFWRRI